MKQTKEFTYICIPINDTSPTQFCNGVFRMCLDENLMTVSWKFKVRILIAEISKEQIVLLVKKNDFDLSKTNFQEIERAASMAIDKSLSLFQ